MDISDKIILFNQLKKYIILSDIIKIVCDYVSLYRITCTKCNKIKKSKRFSSYQKKECLQQIRCNRCTRLTITDEHRFMCRIIYSNKQIDTNLSNRLHKQYPTYEEFMSRNPFIMSIFNDKFTYWLKIYKNNFLQITDNKRIKKSSIDYFNLQFDSKGYLLIPEVKNPSFISKNLIIQNEHKNPSKVNTLILFCGKKICYNCFENYDYKCQLETHDDYPYEYFNAINHSDITVLTVDSDFKKSPHILYSFYDDGKYLVNYLKENGFINIKTIIFCGFYCVKTKNNVKHLNDVKMYIYCGNFKLVQ